MPYRLYMHRAETAVVLRATDDNVHPFGSYRTAFRATEPTTGP